MASARRGRIAGIYEAGKQHRTEPLERARKAAALAFPHLLPQEGHDKSAPHTNPNQSLIASGVRNMAGSFLMTLVPPGIPWHRQRVASSILYDLSVAAEQIEELERLLYMRELAVTAKLEANDGANAARRAPSSFRSRIGQALLQVIGTGDVLQRLTNDYRVRNYRRDRYITLRDSAGEVIHHCTEESVDPLSLSEEHRSKLGVTDEQLAEKRPEDRRKPLYTLVQWQPDSKVWTVSQEIEKRIVHTEDHEVSPFWATAFELSPEADYGIGIIEQHIGDATSYDTLMLRVLEFAAAVTRIIPMLDTGTSLRPEDLTKPTGTPVTGARVAAGAVQDVAFLKVDKLSDFSVAQQVIQSLERQLARVFLLESALQPRGERVTATQIQRLAREIDGALGGAYAPIADSLQTPLVNRAVYQMERDGIIAKLPRGVAQVEIVTGIAALSREMDAAKLAQAMQFILAQPDAAARLNIDVLISAMMRYIGLHIPGLTKDAAQIAAEQQQAIAGQIQLAAAEKAIEVGGDALAQQVAPTG